MCPESLTTPPPQARARRWSDWRSHAGRGAVCSAIAVVAAGACAASAPYARAAARCPAGTPGWELRQISSGNRRIQLITKHLSLATDYVRAPDTKAWVPNTATLLDTRHVTTTSIDYVARTYLVARLKPAMAAVRKERSLAAQMQIAFEGSNDLLKGIPRPRAPKPRGHFKVAGLSAVSYQSSQPIPTRGWYATRLPVPSTAVRRYLPSVVIAKAPANVLLKLEQRDSAGRWHIVLRTTSVRHECIRADDLRVPGDFTRKVPEPPPAGIGALKSALARSGAAHVSRGLGPILEHPNIYMIFWGKAFRDTCYACIYNTLSDALFNGRGSLLDQLGEYQIRNGGKIGMRFVNENPPPQVGHTNPVGYAQVTAFLARQAIRGHVAGDAGNDGPPGAWTGNGHDEMVVLFVPEPAVGAQDWSGYHFAAPTIEGLLLNAIPGLDWFYPVHAVMPFAVVKVPMPLGSGVGNASFDETTRTATREIEEAVTDPIPPTAWEDLSRNPFTEGEIADICGSSAAVPTATGPDLVAPWWSNRAGRCVPVPAPPPPPPDFTAANKVPGVGTAESPALAVFNGRLYMAWRGVGDQNLYWTSFDGTSWAPQQRLDTASSSTGPTLAAMNGKLWMAWKGYATDSHIYYSSFDGARWAPQAVVPGVSTSYGPSLTEYNGRLLMAWKGLGTDPHIYWTISDGSSWAPQGVLSDPIAVTDTRPALAVDHGVVVMTWRNPGDSGIDQATYDGRWESAAKIVGIGTGSGPTLADTGGELFMAWRGVGADQNLYWASTMFPNWDAQRRVVVPAGTRTPTTTKIPALAYYNGRIYLAWREERDPDGPGIWWASHVP